MKKTKKTVVCLDVHSMVDIITNSSSELFVFDGDTKKAVEKLIKKVYPNYRSEYGELKSIDDLSMDDLSVFFDYYCSPHMWPAKKEMYPIPKGFTFEDLYVPETDPSTGGPKIDWNGEVQYRLKTNEDSWNFVDESNFESLKEKLKLGGNYFFLFSNDENPDYKFQQKLEKYGIRMHLG